MSSSNGFSLKDKYLKEDGTIILSGIQALVRLPLDRHKWDQRQGLNTATLISGYRGSPLGTLDFSLQQSEALLKAHNIIFMPGVNEDLAATSIFGSQLANLMPQPKYDGVVGIWYGKGPGVDRTGDIFKHAQIAGVGKNGGVLALAGDDPTAKSSTIPSHSEIALYDAQMPVLYPGTVQEILDLGLLGFALSRYCGSWVGFKIVTNVADEFSTTEVSSERLTITYPEFFYNGRPWQPTQNPALLAPHSLNQEKEMSEGRLDAARLFTAANPINHIVGARQDARLGIVAAGKTYYDLREALEQLGVDGRGLHQYGIRLLKIGMLYPMEPTIVREFAQGLEEILVIEEKRSFIEMFIRDILYNLPDRPRIVGKRDEQDQPLVRSDWELDADEVIKILAKRLRGIIPDGAIDQRLTILQPPPETITLPMLSRTPYFCSGCPHNRSTLVPEGSIQGGGIGCHTLAILMDRDLMGVTQMGGEGAQWVGASPFTEMNHIFQNIGDGTLFHSGSMAIRQALSATRDLGVNMTYKILYNGAVAMTGGQTADGEMPVPELTQALQAEGVTKTIIVSSDVDKYPANAPWANGVEVWERDRMDEAQRLLRDTPGITALIYDQPCATDLRRKRKRGQAADPQERVFINEAVCEGCGDCGVKSNCLSVFPVETEFGRKTQIHQSSCNKDYTCLEGDCPAFMTVIPAENDEPREKKQKMYWVEQALPDPQIKVKTEANLYMVGIGGTGVVTLNQLLATAARLDGKYIRSLDQTGLSQKGGPVVSSLKIFEQPRDVSNKIAIGEADAYLVFDILTGAEEKNLVRARPDKTVAVVSSSQTPTGSMVKSTAVQFPQGATLKGKIEKHTKADDNIYLDAIMLAETLFGNHMPANVITIGAAYQAGLVPISAESIEAAIELNGVAPEANKQAFRVGRLTVADPNWVSTLALDRVGAVKIEPTVTPEAQTILDSTQADGELKRLLAIRIPELIAYQSVVYAQQYVDFVQQVQAAEQIAQPGQTRLSEATTRYLYKLMAYKDEYEVARLYLKSELTEALTEQFGENAQISYKLHPPLLRALGFHKKMTFGPWFKPMFRLLCGMRRVRGTAFDPFGYMGVRRVERTLIDEYQAMIMANLPQLSTLAVYEQTIQLAKLPDMIRGYEEIKLDNVERYRQEVAALQGELVEV
ncbi:MAG: indolepyruvate ferredoxin oxidoreductase family protein [Chloroflexota bacterium]